MKNIKFVCAAIVCLGLAAHAQTAKPESSLTRNPVYQSNCAKCHGKTAEGRFMAGPSLVSGKITALSADDTRNIITKGKHHMPKFEGKLSAADIDALVEQIRAQAKQK
jgi:mono/diheme cytochrome c family protein